MSGYIKNVGDHIRMRWVQSGYDPNSESVPPNKVIFDSDDLGTLSILTKGTVSLSSGNKGSSSSYLQIVTWDFDYVPLCWFTWDMGDGYLTSCFNHLAAFTMLNVRKTGVYLYAVMPVSATLHYTAFNVKAADG